MSEDIFFSPQIQRRYDLLLAGLDLLDQAIAVFDATPCLVTWNKALPRLLEFPPSLLRVGMPFEELVRFNVARGEYGDGDPDALVAARMASARAFEPHYFERERPNGQVLAISGVPIPNLGFISLWSDISDQRRYEVLMERQNSILEERVAQRTSALEQANAEIGEIASALRESETRLQLILDAMPAMIAHLDADTRYLFINRAYARWFGMEREAILGRCVAQIMDADTYASIRENLARALAGETVSYEYARENSSGHTVWARSTAIADVDASGKVCGCYILSIDITEQKAHQVAFIQAQKMEAVGQLTGGLAHDFSNLLTIIIGNLAAMQDQAPEAPATVRFAEPALQAARRGAALIERLLAFSRHQTLQTRDVDVGMLVRGMQALLLHSLNERIELLIETPPEPLYACVDFHQLENVLLNLALNARDAMPEGGQLQVRVSARALSVEMENLTDLPAGPYVRIEVSDNGKGIDNKDLGRVFEPFFTTKPFGQGSGLGLSMVYGFVRRSGGNIRVRSVPGQGTSIAFVLPCVQAPDALPQVAKSKHADADAVGGGAMVLLVEDDVPVRTVIRQQLIDLDYAVLEANDGAEALALLENIPDIALLLSDTVMPGSLSGPQLALRARQLRPHLPVLLMSGYAENEQWQQFGQILRKPFEREALAGALARAATQAPPLAQE